MRTRRFPAIVVIGVYCARDRLSAGCPPVRSCPDLTFFCCSEASVIDTDQKRDGMSREGRAKQC